MLTATPLPSPAAHAPTRPSLKKIMQQLLEAVAYIHSLNLVHCDIKPENILIQSYSQVSQTVASLQVGTGFAFEVAVRR